MIVVDRNNVKNGIRLVPALETRLLLMISVDINGLMLFTKKIFGIVKS
jgi:hypothetical protein